MDTARKEGWGLVALDLNVDTTTPAGEAVANVMATFAHLERRLIGQRTRDALEQRRKAGVRLGRPRQISVEVESSIRRYRDEGLSLASIAERLTADGVRTVGGGSWRVSTLHRVLSRPMDLANQTSAD
jgi:DNA invertase Pin-like site-specific DNA recombinase